MNIVEQAAQRLDELERAGIPVPWAAAGLEERPPAPRPGRAAEAAGAGPEPASAPVPATTRSQATAPAAPMARPAAPARTVEVDLVRLEDAGSLVPRLVQSPLADEFRHIKRALLWNAERDDGPERPSNRLVMVTSALPGEGKTFCAINLAMSIAMEADRSVLLVDADVLRPSLPTRLGVAPERGLLDLLVDPRLPSEDLVLATNVPRLSLLTSGTAQPHASELIAGGAVERLIAGLAAARPERIVIFDAPPLLLAAGAVTLASRMGQVLLVAEALETPRRAVAQAFEALSGCPNVMAVLNKCQPRSGRYAQYYDTARAPDTRRVRPWTRWLSPARR